MYTYNHPLLSTCSSYSSNDRPYLHLLLFPIFFVCRNRRKESSSSLCHRSRALRCLWLAFPASPLLLRPLLIHVSFLFLLRPACYGAPRPFFWCSWIQQQPSLQKP